MQNLFAEIFLSGFRFAALMMIFYLLHRPRTRLRSVLAIGIMILTYPIHRWLFFVSGGNFALSAISETILFLSLAFLCETEQGDFIRPLISALYYNGMIYLINYVSGSYIYAFTGAFSPSFSYLKGIEGALILLWAFYYYRIARKMTTKAPLSFSLLTILTPIVGLVIIIVSSSAASSLLNTGINVYLHGALFGTLIIVLNMCIFYLYIKLSVAHESLIFARDLAHTPPVWTPGRASPMHL